MHGQGCCCIEVTHTLAFLTVGVRELFQVLHMICINWIIFFRFDNLKSDIIPSNWVTVCKVDYRRNERPCDSKLISTKEVK